LRLLHSLPTITSEIHRVPLKITPPRTFFQRGLPNIYIQELLAVAAKSFPEAKLDLDRIGRYFEKLQKNNSDFFDYLRMSLHP